MNRSRSIVEYFGLGDGHRCGYCGNADTNVSHGMWAHCMTCEDYEDLLNRGWRRSGKYVYKPLMNVTCCPMYTIRCDVTKFRPTKSQKKVLKKMNKFLMHGQDQENAPRKGEMQPDSLKNVEVPKEMLFEFQQEAKLNLDDKSPQGMAQFSGDREEDEPITEEVTEGFTERKICKKAKEMRKAKRMKKLAEKQNQDGFAEAIAPNRRENEVKSIEDFIEGIPEKSKLKHHLEVKCCRVDSKCDEFMKHFDDSFELFCKYQRQIHNDPVEKLNLNRVVTVQSHPESKEFLRTIKDEFEVFKKYQMKIHKESEGETSYQQFKRFLVNCPLVPEESQTGRPSSGLGAFHQQYLLDGKLIGVGVIDILPHCLSSKYFFYDPDYSFLSLGTYSALREIYFIRNLQETCPEFKYYYMGYYIHSCQKMRYKGNYDPSYLLCPESYTFQPIKSCVAKLELAPYARLNPENAACTEIDHRNALIVYDGEAMPFVVYNEISKHNKDKRKEDINTVKEYCSLVGDVSKRMLLYRE